MGTSSPLCQVQQGAKPNLSIPKYFRTLKDPRRRHRRLHLLQDILVIALCAVIAGAQDWQQVETFGRKCHRALQNGSPALSMKRGGIPHPIRTHFLVESGPTQVKRSAAGSRGRHR